MADKHNKPWNHIDLNKVNAFKAAEDITAWIADKEIKVRNVAGPRAGKDPLIILYSLHHIRYEQCNLWKDR
jgi:hypothetical protein